MRLRAADRPLRVVHRGLTSAGPENSLAAIRAAAALDVDVVEVDVADVGGTLVLAHSASVARPDSPPLDEALAAFAEVARESVGIQLDVKVPAGAEERIAAAVRAHGLGSRTLVSSNHASVLRTFRRLEPTLALALGYPHDRANAVERGLVPRPAVGWILRAMRFGLAARIGEMVARATADAAMLNHLVVSDAAVRRCHERGVGVFAWTVNGPGDLERVLAAGVDGVVTDDPALLGA